MKEVLLWFENHISELNEKLANADFLEQLEYQTELISACEMHKIVSDHIDRGFTIDEEKFCDQCDWHGGPCQAHPKER